MDPAASEPHRMGAMEARRQIRRRQRELVVTGFKPGSE